VKDPAALARGINALMSEATATAPGSRIRAAAFTERVRALQSHVKIPTATHSAPPRVIPTPQARPSHSQVASPRNWWLPLGGIGAALLLVAGLWLWPQTTAPQPDNATPAVATPANIAENGDNGAAAPLAAGNGAEGPEDDLPAGNVMSTPEPTPIQTPTATPTEPVVAATSTKLAAEASPTPRKATPTPLPVTAPLEKPLAQSLLERGTPGVPSGGTPTKASALASPTVTKLPTATRLPPTRTPVPVTGAAGSAPPLTTASGAELAVELGTPADNAVASGPVRFTWTPSRALLANECFEVRFWPVGGSWRAGFGIWGANRNSFVERDFNGAFAADYRSLSRGLTYSWGVLLVECTTGTVQELVSSIRSIRYNPTP
jgi:hypothetical protein